MGSILKMGGVHLADRDWLPKQEALDFLTLEKLDTMKRDFTVDSSTDIRDYLDKNDVYNPRKNIAWFGDDEGIIIDGVNIGPLTQERKDAIQSGGRLDEDDEEEDDDDEEAPNEEASNEEASNEETSDEGNSGGRESSVNGKDEL